MRRCPSCGANVLDTRVVCERCGHDVAPGKGDGVYGRGALSLLLTRAGLRFAAVFVGLAIAVGGMALGVSTHVIMLVTVVVFGGFALWAIIRIFRP